jgi:hypothetical protein
MLNRLALAGAVYGLAPTPESQVRIRLPAGGNGIRTLGPPRERVGLGVASHRLYRTRFAIDSPLEERRFEPSVPLLRTAPGLLPRS